MKETLKQQTQSQPTQLKEENEIQGQQLAPPPFQLAVDSPGDSPSEGGGSGNSGNLPGHIQAKMENSFGHDFSNVNIDANSSEATEMGAQAFAQGNNIGFAPGKFNPESNSGQALLGHELSHVVQQREGRVKPTVQAKSGAPINDDPGLEKEADQQGAQAARGEKVKTSPSGSAQTAGSSVQRSTDYNALAQELNTELNGEQRVDEVVKIMVKVPPGGGFQQLSSAYNLISRTPLVMHLQQVFSDEEDYNRVMESVVGMSVSQTTTGTVAGSTGPSLYSLRAGNTTSSLIIGQLDGSSMPIVVTGKGTGSDIVWFKVKFKNATDYERVTGTKKDEVSKSGNAEAMALMANQEAWVSEAALNLYVTWDAFMSQIALFDIMTYNLDIKAKVTKLRQMCHSSDLPFDTIIGTDSGDYYQDNRPDTHQFFQILDSAQGVMTPNGEIVDMYHFIVGLDAYQKDRRKSSSGPWYSSDAGPSDAAATWAGDIGAAATDMVMKTSDDMEKKLHSEEERLEFYYNSRAPESDLLADIDAWGAYEEVDNESANNLYQVINGYYGVQKLGADSFKPKRRKALENMFAQYGLSTASGSLLTGGNAAILTSSIYKFGCVWREKRVGWGLLVESGVTAVLQKMEIKSVSLKMALKFLKMLEREAKANGVI